MGAYHSSYRSETPTLAGDFHRPYEMFIQPPGRGLADQVPNGPGEGQEEGLVEQVDP